MTCFVSIADTHLGAAPMGYQQQPGYPDSNSSKTLALNLV